MMGMTRKIITFLVGVISLPVLYLNVEVFAQRQGWDKVLADFLQNHAGWALKIGLHPVTLYAATSLCSLTVGLWLADFLKQFETHRESKMERFRNLYSPMYDLVELVRENQSNWSGAYLSQGSRVSQQSLHGEVLSFFLKAESAGLSFPDLKTYKDENYAKALLFYLKNLLPLVRDGHFKEAKVLSKELCEGIKTTLSKQQT
jgi:hypothetical protein